MSNTQVHLTYSEPLIRRVVRQHMLHLFGRQALVSLALCLVMLILFLATGRRDWLFGLMLAALLAVVLGYPYMYLTYLRRTLQSYREMAPPTLVVAFDATALTMSGSLGSSTLAWPLLKNVWRYDEAWMLGFHKGQTSILPLAGLNEESQAFILERVAEHGGAIWPPLEADED